MNLCLILIQKSQAGKHNYIISVVFLWKHWENIRMGQENTGTGQGDILHIEKKRIIIGEYKIKEGIPDGKDHKRHDNR